MPNNNATGPQAGGPQDPPGNGGPPDNPGPPAPGPQPLTKAEQVEQIITRLSNVQALTPAEVRPIATFYKDLYRDLLLNPEDEQNIRLWKQLQRRMAQNWTRDDGVLLKFCEKIIKIRPARSLEEVERHRGDVQNLKDSDIPSSAQVQNEIAAERQRVRESQERDTKERERIARGEPINPKDIPVSLESLTEQEQQIPGPPSPRTGRR